MARMGDGGEAVVIGLVQEARPHLVVTGPETEIWFGRLEEHRD